MISNKKDRIFNKPLTSIQDFKFDENVASAFDDMIQRSVPYYQEIQYATAEITKKLAVPNSNIYDLGCSTGTTLIYLMQVINNTSINIIGVDNSKPMLAMCKEKLREPYSSARVRLIESNIEDVALSNACVVIMNYSLQFIAPKRRAALASKIWDALLPGGAWIVTEKVTNKNPSLDNLLTELYYDFKRRNGYSNLEIAQKREALEEVLIPWSTEENLQLFHNAGFKDIEIFLKWYNFASFVGRKL
jgi:tRNA (cmo5U34)-methyltransferase